MSRRNTYLISFPKQKHSSTWKVYTSRPRSITGQYTKTLTHHVDTYGRNVGYSIDSIRQSALSYDPVTSRMLGMNATEGDFTWNYLANSNLKSKLTYPNRATAEWTYEPKRNLLTSVTNSLCLSDSVINPQVISQYDYTNDAIARRTAMGKSGIMMAVADTIDYGYNARSEVISADAQQDTDYLFSYAFDDIGNRETGEGKTYIANALNQYTQINEGILSPNSQPLTPNNSVESTNFVPSYDANGNQILVKTSTGTWTVVYNAKNRPITWTKGDTVITMEYDRMGRRISYKKMQGDTLLSHAKFLYKGYLCVQELSANTPWNVLKAFIWDPTEAIATRPLVFTEGEQTAFYMHDGNKNVTDVISSTPASSDVTHYDYAPFGAVTRTVAATVSTQNASPITHNSELRSANPFRFSSEWHDDDLGLVYYNYRHYNPTDGRWVNRDPIEELGGHNLYGFVENKLRIDLLGLRFYIQHTYLKQYEMKISICICIKGSYKWKSTGTSIYEKYDYVLHPIIQDSITKRLLKNTLDEFLPSSLEDVMIGQLISESLEYIHPYVATAYSIGTLFTGSYNVVSKTFVSPPQSFGIDFGSPNKRYRYDSSSSMSLFVYSLSGQFDNIGRHTITKGCTKATKGQIFTSIVLKSSKLIENP